MNRPDVVGVAYQEQEHFMQGALEAYRERPVSEWEIYEFYTGEKTAREQTKQAFMSGEVRNPVLDYPKLTEEKMAEVEQEKSVLLGILKDGVMLDYDTERELVFYDIVRTRFLELEMLSITHNFATGAYTSEAQRQSEAEAFTLASSEAYGRLDEGYFGAILQTATEQAMRGANKLIADDFLSLVGQPTSTKEKTVPTPEELEQLVPLLREVDADIIASMPKKPEGMKYAVEDLFGIIENVLQARGYSDWSVQYTDGSKLEARQSEKVIYIGRDREPKTYTETLGIVAHEVGVHVASRENGDALEDPLLAGLGLPGYLSTEEGVASVKEEIHNQETGTSGIPYYFALGMALGMDGKKRDFRDTYEVFWRFLALKNGSAVSANSELLQAAKDEAYLKCVRIFRGTPCDIPGMVYTKDQSYFIGAEHVWSRLLGELRTSKEAARNFLWLSTQAKYNRSSPAQEELVVRAISKRQRLINQPKMV